ncbi:MAG: hypothetical protein ABI559_10950 [Chloroflexota bacterium]
MSGGWENLPKDAPKGPAPAARPRKREVPAVALSAAVSETDTIEDGEWISRIEYYFPQIWLGMLSILCALGIYCAVGKLPNAPW